MELKDLEQKALEVRSKYQKIETKIYGRTWNTAELAQGLVVDIGELTELIMAKSKMRKYKGINIDADLAHELCDLLWNILVLAHDLNINLEKEFSNSMKQADKKLSV